MTSDDLYGTLFESHDAPPKSRARDTYTIDDVPLDVRQMFERLSLQVHARGWTHYSSDAILHRIRWEMQIERGHRSFKCNNNWTAPLARWFLARHPDMVDFFELRERQ